MPISSNINAFERVCCVSRLGVHYSWLWHAGVIACLHTGWSRLHCAVSGIAQARRQPAWQTHSGHGSLQDSGSNAVPWGLMFFSVIWKDWIMSDGLLHYLVRYQYSYVALTSTLAALIKTRTNQRKCDRFGWAGTKPRPPTNSSFSKRDILLIIRHDLGLKCLNRRCTHDELAISRYCLAKQLNCCDIVSNHFIANSLLNVPVNVLIWKCVSRCLMKVRKTLGFFRTTL